MKIEYRTAAYVELPKSVYGEVYIELMNSQYFADGIITNSNNLKDDLNTYGDEWETLTKKVMQDILNTIEASGHKIGEIFIYPKRNNHELNHIKSSPERVTAQVQQKGNL